MYILTCLKLSKTIKKESINFLFQKTKKNRNKIYQTILKLFVKKCKSVKNQFLVNLSVKKIQDGLTKLQTVNKHSNSYKKCDKSSKLIRKL